MKFTSIMHTSFTKLAPFFHRVAFSPSKSKLTAPITRGGQQKDGSVR